MEDDEINIKIEEFLGWTVHSGICCEVIPDKHGDPELEPIGDVRDYCNDLNFMHEAVQSLSEPQKADFAMHLNHLTGQEKKLCGWIHLVCEVTSRQRAEAFIKTIEK